MLSLLITAALANQLNGAHKTQIASLPPPTSSQVSYSEDTAKKIFRVTAEDGTQFVIDAQSRTQYIIFPDKSVETRSLAAD